MKSRNILYIVITVICVIAVVVAVYYQIFKRSDNVNHSNNSNNSNAINNENIDLEKIKNEFDNLFTNEFNMQGYEIANIEKLNQSKDIIYAAYNIKQEKENKYSVNINLPVFNIKSELASEFNSITQTVFANKATEVLNNKEDYIIYNVDYTSYLNDNILSLVIKSTLKEGANAQRIIVQTYNYDLETGKKVILNDILNEKQINKEDVNKKIEKQVTYAKQQAEAIAQATSQVVYKRDLNNAMYLTDNINNFFLGEDGKIYIVYAYGNSNFTSEMDVIII